LLVNNRVRRRKLLCPSEFCSLPEGATERQPNSCESTYVWSDIEPEVNELAVL
jgi:hypothetical protein